jgi:hypothetical protein
MKVLNVINMIALISFLCFQTNAQTYRIKGGLNLANMLIESDGEVISNQYKMNPGFHVGATFDLPLNEFLSIETGPLLTTKGWKQKFESGQAFYTFNNNLYYLDFPIALKTTYGLARGLKLFGYFGPYAGIGLSGKMNLSVEYEGRKNTDKQNIEWGKDGSQYDYTRFEMGLTIGIGVERNSLMTGISYDHGLSNISSFQKYGELDKNRVLKFSVGYIFGK